MKRILLCVCLGMLGCPAPSSKGNNTVVVNNANNGNNVNNADGGNNVNNVSDVNVQDFPINEDGPQFVDVSVSPPSMTEGGSVTVLAQVTDPQGFDDIGGGRVLDAADNVYGNFTGSGGSYSIDISWSDIEQYEEITFDDELVLTLIAEFFDGTGNTNRRAFDIRLECGGETACDGQCGLEDCMGTCQEAFTGEMACGACDNMCNTGQVCENDTSCQNANYLEACNSVAACTIKGLAPMCGIVFQGDDTERCFSQCDPNDPLSCGLNPCVQVGGNVTICFTDCTNNAAICQGDLTCEDVGNGVRACVPPLPEM